MLARLAALAAILMLSLATASAQEKIRFTLDWKLQGLHAWYYWAADKGYFKAEGLDVTIDQGEGSAATVTRIMGGAYDAGFGDINAVMQTGAERPGEQPVMVYLVYNRAPYALIAWRSSPALPVVGATLVVARFAYRLSQQGDHKGRPYMRMRDALT